MKCGDVCIVFVPLNLGRCQIRTARVQGGRPVCVAANTAMWCNFQPVHEHSLSGAGLFGLFHAGLFCAGLFGLFRAGLFCAGLFRVARFFLFGLSRRNNLREMHNELLYKTNFQNRYGTVCCLTMNSRRDTGRPDGI